LSVKLVRQIFRSQQIATQRSLKFRGEIQVVVQKIKICSNFFAKTLDSTAKAKALDSTAKAKALDSTAKAKALPKDYGLVG
jgi:hypothetical protein